MKRFLFSVCALAAVVVGCSKSEVLNRPNAEMPIEFNPYTGRVPVTKATAADIDTLGEAGFKVYAFIHEPNVDCDYTATPYMNKTVTRVGDTWSYSGHAYWPATNLLNFVAYGLNANVTERSKTEITFDVAENVAEQKDLLVAYREVNAAYSDANQGVVNFNFSHLLSRIGFSLVTKNGNQVPVTIEQLNLVGNFYSNGFVRLTDGVQTTLTIGEAQITLNRPYVNVTESTASQITYKLLGEGGTYTHEGSADGTKIFNNGLLYTKNWGENQSADNNTTTDDDEYDAKAEADITETDRAIVAANEKNRYMMIIPAAGTVHNAKLLVKYFLPGAGTFEEVSVDLKDVDFEAGKSYDFKLKVSTNGISFDVAVEAWDVTGENREIIQLN